MKRICTLLLAAGMLLGVATGASAIDFKAKGQWLVGFAGGENQLLSKTRTGANGSKQKYDSSDKFAAQQRVRLQLDAVASEALSGTVFFEIGNQTWGKAEQGGALGADGTMVKVKRAYIDWLQRGRRLRHHGHRRRGRHRLLSVQRKRGADRPVGASAQRQLHR